MAISRAIKKYGNDAFDFEVIAACKTWEDANETETALVQQYSSLVPIGYNVSLGGMNAPKSEAWKQAMSAIKGGWIGKEHTPKNLETFRLNKLGTQASEETKQKQSETMKKKVEEGWMPINIFTPETAAVWQGKTFSEEHKQHISEGLMGREVSEETRQRISQSQIGKVIPADQRQKMSEAAKGQHRSPQTEFQKGLVPWNTGIPHTEEAKAKMSASKKGQHFSPATEFKPKFLTDPQIEEIRQLLSQGLSLRKIEKLTGMGRHFISKEIKRLGLKSGS